MIINPNTFYWINVLNTIKITMMLITGLALVAYPLFLLIAKDEVNDNLYKKVRIWALIGIIIGLVLLIFIPDKETSVEMLIAKYATVSNIKEITNYIMTAVQSCK